MALCLCSVLGCGSGAQPNINVHLFTESMTDEQVQKLTKSVRKRGSVRVNSTSHGEVIEHPTIVVPFLLSDGSLIDSLEGALYLLGYDRIEFAYQSKGKHSYTTNNIGVYLPNTDSIESPFLHTKMDSLVQTYGSECPQMDAQLKLLDTGSASLETYDSDTLGREVISSALEGRWERVNDEVKLYLGLPEELTFIIQRLTRQELNTTYSGIVLVGRANGTIYSGCDFVNIGYIGS